MWNSVKTCQFVLWESVFRGRRFGFRMVVAISQSKWLIAPKKKNPLKIFMLWDAWKSIKLINMNFNKYPSSCKVQSQKWWWTKLGIKILLKQLGETKCTKKCAPKMFPKITSQFVPYSLPISLGLYCIYLVKWKYYHSPILVENAFIWGIFKTQWFFFCDRPVKVTCYK